MGRMLLSSYSTEQGRPAIAITKLPDNKVEVSVIDAGQAQAVVMDAALAKHVFRIALEGIDNVG